MSKYRIPPEDTPQGREDQLISLAYDLVERRLLDGSATAQETVTFIKMGSQREKLERARIEQENLLLSAKVEDIASRRRVENLVADAIDAFRMYSGNGSDEMDDEYDEY